MSRPFVFLNMASTVDGKITSSRREFPQYPSKHDRHHMDELRSRADALMVGAGTLRADDPALHIRSESARRSRGEAGKSEGLPTVIVLGHGTLPPNAKVFHRNDGARVIVATLNGRSTELRSQLPATIEFQELGRDSVDLAELLRRLEQEGVQSLLLEGGGELNACMFEQSLVDEINLTLCPCLLGGRDAPTFVEGAGWPMKDRQALSLLSCEERKGEIFLRYRVKHR